MEAGYGDFEGKDKEVEFIIGGEEVIAVELKEKGFGFGDRLDSI